MCVYSWNLSFKRNMFKELSSQLIYRVRHRNLNNRIFTVLSCLGCVNLMLLNHTDRMNCWQVSLSLNDALRPLLTSNEAILMTSSKVTKIGCFEPYERLRETTSIPNKLWFTCFDLLPISCL